TTASITSNFTVGTHSLTFTVTDNDGLSSTDNVVVNVNQLITVVLSWNTNAEPDLAGYRVYYGDTSGNYTNNVDIGNITSYTQVVTGTSDIYYAIKAYNDSGIESDYSVEVVYNVSPPPTTGTVQTISLSWDPNTGTDTAGYKVYYGDTTGIYGNNVDVGNVTSYTLSTTTSSDVYISLIAYDVSGNESGFAAEVIYSAPVTTTAARVVANSKSAADTFRERLQQRTFVDRNRVFRKTIDKKTGRARVKEVGIEDNIKERFEISINDDDIKKEMLLVDENGSPYKWQPLALRTGAQRDLGILGGEGMQEVWGVSYAPSNPEILYLVTDTSQVWKSEDGGDSWQMKHKGFLANGGISLAVNPNNENVVFVAGSSHSKTESNDTADGIYRTKDGGETWELVKQTPFYRIDERGGTNFDFTKMGLIYAGTHEEGLLRSLDGGDTWEGLPLNFPTGKILDVKKHPDDLYSLFIVAEKGVYKIKDDDVAEMVKADSHFFLKNKSFCARCHSDWIEDEMELPSEDNIFNPIPTELNETGTCLGCHNVEDEAHPVNIVPEQATPADLPLGNNGEITCLTCHYTHGARESDEPYVSETMVQKIFSFGKESYKTFYLRRNNSEGELCNACHLDSTEFGFGDNSDIINNADE
ncbi:MAG: hypothetical protein ACUZ8O_10580, partial [Candidatus Anammoxibacter sp.]